MPWFSRLKRKISTSPLGKRQWQIAAIALVAIAVILWLYRFDWTGFGEGESVTTTITTRDANGNVIETVATTPESGKTLWDWLGLLGVPLTLAGLGYLLQQEQQKQATKDQETQREIAAEEAGEEVLQSYFDRLSTLLIDKNLLAIAVKVHGTAAGEKGGTSEEQELLDAAVDVMRARTLSILRRFENDSQRKTSVIRFLIEAEVLSKAKLSLSFANLISTDLIGADLSRADLSRADLIGANLMGASLRYANLCYANINNANLCGANIIGTDLCGAYLCGTDLRGSKISGANLSGANLSGASLRYADLSRADLSRADLSDADLTNADLTNANLRRSPLIKTNFSGAKDLTQEQLLQARICNIVLPDGMDLDPNRDCDALKRDYPELFQ